MKKFIIVKTQFEMIHKWENCPSHLNENYLSHPHRHLFYVEIKKEVNHLDRNIEFIDFKHNIDEYIMSRWDIKKIYLDSCEMIATDLLKKFDAYSVKVFEDNENGAEVINA